MKRSYDPPHSERPPLTHSAFTQWDVAMWQANRLARIYNRRMRVKWSMGGTWVVLFGRTSVTTAMLHRRATPLGQDQI